MTPQPSPPTLPLEARRDQKILGSFDKHALRTQSGSMTLLAEDLEQFGLAALQEFDREWARKDRAGDEEFERQAQRLEAKLEQLYAVAATVAQREPALAGVAAIWTRMVSICDQMAKALSESHQAAPLRSDSYDRILDIRNVCEENRALHA